MEEAGRRAEAEAEALVADLGEALQALLDHKLACQAALDGVASHLRGAARALAATPLPC